jgi:tetratricopeptide (TPR) repeat protein
LSGVLAVTGVAGGSFETRTIAPGSSFEAADERVAEALAIAREIGWRPGEAFALGVKVGLYGNHGRYEEAIAAGTEALSLSEEIGHRQWQTASHCILGMTYNSIFSADRGRYHLERALMLAHEIGSPYWQRDCAAHLAMSWLLLGNTARAAEVVDRAMTPDLPALVIGQRELWLSYGELCAAQGRWDDALAVTARLSNAPGVDGDLTRLPHVAWLAARAHAALGRIEEAERLLRGACDTAVTAAPVLTWLLQAVLGSLLQARDAAEAAAWLAKAAAGADAIAQSLPPDLRASFLTAPAYTEVVRQPRPAAP